MSEPQMLRYDIVNVFIAHGRPYTGNPLAVIYGGHDLTQAQCLTLGRQFNLSEITFPENVEAQSDASYHVRIFTPGSELPFAGHPTLGTCFALLHGDLKSAKPQKKVSQHSKAGETKLRFSTVPDSPYAPARMSMRATARFVSGRLPEFPDLLPQVLGLSGQQLSIKCVREASCGLPWNFVHLDAPVDTLKAIRINSSALTSWVKQLRSSATEPTSSSTQSRPDAEDGIVVFTTQGLEDNTLKLFVRVFFQDGAGLIEDPATGSAGLAMGLVLYEEKLLPSSLSYSILQGTEISMSSQLFGRVEEDEKQEAVAVHLSGDVVKVGSGKLVRPA